jgi:hypothetical protein
LVNEEDERWSEKSDEELSIDLAWACIASSDDPNDAENWSIAEKRIAIVEKAIERKSCSVSESVK